MMRAEVVITCFEEFQSSEGQASTLEAYVTDEEKTLGCYGYLGVCRDGIERQFAEVYRVFGLDGSRSQALHFSVSLGALNCILEERLCDLAYAIGAYFGREHQLLWGIHFNTNTLHIHYVVNKAGFLTGDCLAREDIEGLGFQRHANRALRNYIRGIEEK